MERPPLKSASSLLELCKANLKLHPEYRGGLSNHLSMTAYSLHALTEAQIFPKRNWVNLLEIHEKKLEAMHTLRPEADFSSLTDEEKRMFAGDFSTLDSWIFYYRNLFSKDSSKDTLEKELSFLSRGLCPAVAGHGILRITFALRMKELLPPDVWHEELAFAFAYAASRYLVLYPQISQKSKGHQFQVPFQDTLENVPPLSLEKKQRYRKIGLIFMRAKLLALDHKLSLKVERTDLDFSLIEILKSLSAVAVKNPNFELLHCITVGHAIQWLERSFLTSPNREMRLSYVEFVVAVFAANGIKLSEGFHEFLDVPDDALKLALADTRDEHAIKAGFALNELHKQTGEAVFMHAALSFAQR